eukprot:gene3336-13364_t
MRFRQKIAIREVAASASINAAVPTGVPISFIFNWKFLGPNNTWTILKLPTSDSISEERVSSMDTAESRGFNRRRKRSENGPKIPGSEKPARVVSPFTPLPFTNGLSPTTLYTNAGSLTRWGVDINWHVLTVGHIRSFETGTHRGSETLSTDGEVKGYAEFDDSSREGGLFGKAFDDSLHVPYLPELTFDDEPLTDPLAGLETACQPADDAQAEIALIIHHFKESQKGTRLVNMDHLALTLLGFGYMAQFITCIGRQVGTDEPTYFPIPIIIEPHFRLQFCLNHSTPQYNRLMQATPIAFVGTQGQLSALVRILAAEIVQILSPGAIKGLLPSHAPYPNSAMTTGGATSTWLLIYPRIISMWLPAELNKLEDTLSFLAFSEPLPNTNLTCTMHTAPALTVPDMSHPLLRWSSSQLYQEPCERIDLQECTMHMAPAPTVSDMSHSLLRWPSSQLYQEPYERIDLQECTMHTASALTVHDRSHSLLRWASSQLYQEPYERIEPQELSCISDELCNSERADARIDELLDTGRFDGRSSDPNGVLKTLLESMKCIAMEHLDGIPDMLPPDFHCVPEKQENKRGAASPQPAPSQPVAGLPAIIAMNHLDSIADMLPPDFHRVPEKQETKHQEAGEQAQLREQAPTGLPAPSQPVACLPAIVAMDHLDSIPDMLPTDFHSVPEKQESKRGWLSKLQRSVLRPRSRRASTVA